jgi:hypothetical protein
MTERLRVMLWGQEASNLTEGHQRGMVEKRIG